MYSQRNTWRVHKLSGWLYALIYFQNEKLTDHMPEVRPLVYRQKYFFKDAEYTNSYRDLRGAGVNQQLYRFLKVKCRQVKYKP